MNAQFYIKVKLPQNAPPNYGSNVITEGRYRVLDIMISFLPPYKILQNDQFSSEKGYELEGDVHGYYVAVKVGHEGASVGEKVCFVPLPMATFDGFVENCVMCGSPKAK